ncbi:hypothetical protein ACHHYP_01443 [Achlya hypogyna]|uniref:Uncharacterized protein n=1 Tax=Achlya hypogyna TaxID=1202772 RepID=A0A1V9Z8P3_ACHHY|nr:hypothetical protein ACHHYP_01443 [Achlya hypogyna]
MAQALAMELPSLTSHKKQGSNSLPLQLEPLGHKPKQTLDAIDLVQQFDPNVSPPKYKLDKLPSVTHSPTKEAAKEPDMSCRKQPLQAIAPNASLVEKSTRHSSHGHHSDDSEVQVADPKELLRPSIPHLQHLAHD